MAQDNLVQLDIVSDVMCPWCYIGKKRLEKALEARPDITVDIRWRPYQLDATIPEGGMPRQDYIEQKFGDKGTEVYGRIAEAGEGEGIPFAFDKIEKSPNTLNAHRLIRWAATANVQNQVVERLFRAYFEEGADLTDKTFLADVAEEAGMERAVVERLLEGDADKDLVQQEIDLAQRMGVQGVPCFIFDNKYVVMGAQESDVLLKAFDTTLADEETGQAQGEGQGG